jgi:hypothetical protein
VLQNCGVFQEQKKAASEKKAVMAALTKGQEESVQKAKEVASLPSESNEAKRKHPVGAYVSSVHVDYESFEVGTGQVSYVLTRALWFMLEACIFLFFFFFFFVVLGLNSGPTPWATSPALFCDLFFF